MTARSPRSLLALFAMALASAAGGCAATIPPGSYGVSSLEIEGTESIDEMAIEACLATYPRERFGFTLGAAEDPSCGVPPFDAARTPVRLWAWPWTDWPLFNETAFDRDLARVERFYRARGYYQARVTDVKLERDPEEREIDIALTVHEGEPVLVVRIDVLGIEALEPKVQRALHDAIALEIGEPFDETLYDRSKQAMLDALAEFSYAKAQVTGRARIDPENKLARVEFTVDHGLPCSFGDLIVEGQEEFPVRPIKAAADIRRGQPFSLSALRDARRAVAALGPFASVRTEQHPRPDSDVVDVLLRVVPARRFRFGVGVGIESGGIYSQDAVEGVSNSFAQWDVHLLGKIEHKNFLGGMRRLRIEERPRRIFDNPLPDTSEASWGNRLTLELRQPAFVEARTTLVAQARWDRGPDPYGGRFLRHDVIAGVGPERYFFNGKLLVASSVNLDLLLPDQQQPYPNTQLPYFYHRARLDLRDDPRNTRRGTFYALGLQHTVPAVPADWDYVRITGEVRGYLPLPAGMVLAGRVRLGFMTVIDSRISVPMRPADCLADRQAELMCQSVDFRENLARYGPLRQRLRGGGQNSVRGYAANTLGDVEVIDNRLLSGGLRQWETSIELRLPITSNFGTAVFVDAGDVSRSTRYRFNYPQTSIGLGLRYRTLIGPIRFDAALAPDGLQVIGKDERVREGIRESTLLGLGHGAMHITIGEAF